MNVLIIKMAKFTCSQSVLFQYDSDCCIMAYNNNNNNNKGNLILNKNFKWSKADEGTNTSVSV